MGPGASIGDYVHTIRHEAQLGAQAIREAGLPSRPVETIFFGGGTPTMLTASMLTDILGVVENEYGIAQGAEITVEANPDTLNPTDCQQLANGGVTRLSIGMQSAVPHVLRTLDRTHTPEHVPLIVDHAKAVGLSTSLDLIYGASGESIDDWRTTVRTAIDLNPDHISAYSLIIEQGTKMAAQVARGELPKPDEDDQATKYEIADALLSEAGYHWYEISNFARSGHESQHNLAYWRDWDWWALGPGAHWHLGDVRGWNTKHPIAWAGQVGQGHLPVAGHEIITPDSRHLEYVMLAIRTREGLDASLIDEAVRHKVVPTLIADELIDPFQAFAGRIVLTLRGRLLADYVTGQLLEFSA